ncbi:MAG: hypothetical protein DPW09_42610 [Anaerolineae bacterium]|nr:hypothetical protein [Anaerolineae bacterium]
MFQQINMISSIAGTTFFLAKINYSLGRVDEAKKQAEMAYEIFSKLGSHHLPETDELLEAINQAPNDPSAYLAKHGKKHLLDLSVG